MITADWTERLAVVAIMGPTTMFALPIYAAFSEPSILVRDWDFFVPFLGLPYLAGIALWVTARRMRRSETTTA